MSVSVAHILWEWMPAILFLLAHACPGVKSNFSPLKSGVALVTWDQQNSVDVLSFGDYSIR